jgi:hypothetical protein
MINIYLLINCLQEKIIFQYYYEKKNTFRIEIIINLNECVYLKLFPLL